MRTWVNYYDDVSYSSQKPHDVFEISYCMKQDMFWMKHPSSVDKNSNLDSAPRLAVLIEAGQDNQ